MKQPPAQAQICANLRLFKRYTLLPLFNYHYSLPYTNWDSYLVLALRYNVFPSHSCKNSLKKSNVIS